MMTNTTSRFDPPLIGSLSSWRQQSTYLKESEACTADLSLVNKHIIGAIYWGNEAVALGSENGDDIHGNH